MQLGVVETEGGLVEGKSHNMGLFRTVDVFKGVPFADVPGKWEKPKPHPGWSGRWTGHYDITTGCGYWYVVGPQTMKI